MSRLRELWNWSHSIGMELTFDSEITSVSVDELKERLLLSLAGRPANLAAWDPGIIIFGQLKEGLKTLRHLLKYSVLYENSIPSGRSCDRGVAR